MALATAGRVGRLWILPLASALACGCGYVNTRESSYATIDEAHRARAPAEGRVPDGLPASARDIRERHRADGTEVWGRFEFDETDRASVGRACRPTDAARTPMPGSETRATAWWAGMLTSDSPTAAEHFQVYTCAPAGRAGTWFLAVHRRLPTAFFWTAPQR